MKFEQACQILEQNRENNSPIALAMYYFSDEHSKCESELLKLRERLERAEILLSQCSGHLVEPCAVIKSINDYFAEKEKESKL